MTHWYILLHVAKVVIKRTVSILMVTQTIKEEAIWLSLPPTPHPFVCHPPSIFQPRSINCSYKSPFQAQKCPLSVVEIQPSYPQLMFVFCFKNRFVSCSLVTRYCQFVYTIKTNETIEDWWRIGFWRWHLKNDDQQFSTTFGNYASFKNRCGRINTTLYGLVDNHLKNTYRFVNVGKVTWSGKEGQEAINGISSLNELQIKSSIFVQVIDGV